MACSSINIISAHRIIIKINININSNIRTSNSTTVPIRIEGVLT